MVAGEGDAEGSDEEKRKTEAGNEALLAALTTEQLPSSGSFSASRMQCWGAA